MFFILIYFENLGIISAKTVTEIRQDVITGGKINILTVSLTY